MPHEMNHINVAAGIAAIVAVYLVQLMLSNRSGSEKAVACTISNIQYTSWSFVALQYCYGISNRTYMVFVTDKMICGAKVRGVLPAPIKITERWNDPFFYPRPEVVAKYSSVNIEAPQFKQIDSANFQILREDVDTLVFSADRKWGMGTVPYSGRLFINLNRGSKIELILLGTQDGLAIRDRLAQGGFGKPL